MKISAVPVFIVVFNCIIAQELPKGYLGCYKENNGRSLKAHKGSLGEMTPQFCVTLCKNIFLPVAGVQFGTHCFCGTYDELTLADRVSDESCSMPCAGNHSQYCGHGWHNSVYKVAWRYLGCYAELPGRMFKNNQGSTAEQTPDYCKELCEAAELPLAGVQSASWCFCGTFEELEKAERRPEMECSSACNGDKMLSCGGANRNAVYESGFVPDNVNVTKLAKHDTECYF